MKNNNCSIIFVAGSSRSGTTMFNRILGNHPSILALNELHYIGKSWDINSEKNEWSREKSESEAAKLLAVARRSIWNAKLTNDEIKESKSLFHENSYKPLDIFEKVLSYLCKKKNKQLATDQTPGNILYVNQILNSIPNAKVIHLVRDPRAVLYSQKNRWKQRSLGAKGIPMWNAFRVFVNYHVYTIAKLWKAAYMSGKKVVEHQNYMRLKFEDLVDNPRVSLDKVCQFLDLDFMPEMLDVPRVGSSNLKHREDVKGISSDVIDAWKGKLSKSEIWICERINKAAMRDMRYETLSTKLPWFGVFIQLLLYPIHALGVVLANPRLALRMTRAINRKIMKSN